MRDAAAAVAGKAGRRGGRKEGVRVRREGIDTDLSVRGGESGAVPGEKLRVTEGKCRVALVSYFRELVVYFFKFI